MDTQWVPSVDLLGTCGRGAYASSTRRIGSKSISRNSQSGSSMSSEQRADACAHETAADLGTFRSRLATQPRRDLALPGISCIAQPALGAPTVTMKPPQTLRSHRAAIRSVAQAHRACNARVFGSVLHGRDTDDSDLDILVDPTFDTTLFDISAIRIELRRLLGVPVDVLTPNALPDKFRAAVLAKALPARALPVRARRAEKIAALKTAGPVSKIGASDPPARRSKPSCHAPTVNPRAQATSCPKATCRWRLAPHRHAAELQPRPPRPPPRREEKSLNTAHRRCHDNACQSRSTSDDCSVGAASSFHRCSRIG